MADPLKSNICMSLEKKVVVGLVLCSSVFILLYAITITILYAQQSSNSIEQSKNKCDTIGCVQIAARIADYIDDKIHPCENFYRFANGRYIQDQLDEDDDEDNDVSHNMFDTASESMNKRIGKLLNDKTSDFGSRAIDLAKSFYKSCLENDLHAPYIVRRDNDKIQSIFEALGGWPVVEGSYWNENNFNLVKLIEQVKKEGFHTNILFKVGVASDPENASNVWLYINNGTYTSDMEDLEETIREFADEDADDAEIKEQIKSMKKFAQRLSSYNIEDENDTTIENDSTFQTISELQIEYPYLNWLGYINAILPDGINVDKTERIENKNQAFFKALGNIFKKASNRSVTNYIVCSVIYMAKKMESFTSGKKHREECVDLTSEKFPIPVAKLYSKKYFNETSRKAAIDLVENVTISFLDMINVVPWMENETKMKAVRKVKYIIRHVAYPNDLDIRELNEYYEDLLSMEADDFFTNSLKLNIFNHQKWFSSLNTPLNRSQWELFADTKLHEANAFYYPQYNVIYLPIAILHEQFFAVDRPRYINYATLGNTVGHEITHSLDANGRQYDLYGNFVDWWNPETAKTFDKNAKCFVKQYNSYSTKSQRKVDGSKTLDENIADNGGTRAAYYAYIKWSEENPPEQLVPSTTYNQKQLFWISYAQAEAGVYGQHSIDAQLAEDEHSPSEFRVNGVVSNAVEFATDFNCPVGSAMNPKEKCKIW